VGASKVFIVVDLREMKAGESVTHLAAYFSKTKRYSNVQIQVFSEKFSPVVYTFPFYTF